MAWRGGSWSPRIRSVALLDFPQHNTAPSRAVEPAAFRAVMSRFATSVTVISHWHGNEPAGMTANAFLSVSMEPPLILVSVRRQSQFNACVSLGDRYGVNFLAEDQQALSSHFGGRRNPDAQAAFFEMLDTPLLEGSLAHVVARVIDVHDAGDHVLHIAEVELTHQGRDARPLIFFGGTYKQIQAHAAPVQWHSADGW